MNTFGGQIVEALRVILTIASKDIVDAVKNKLILSLIIGLSIMILMPMMMSLIVAPPYTDVAVFDADSSRLAAELEENPRFRLHRTRSLQELESVLNSAGLGLGVELGLVIPADFDQRLQTGQPVLEGYVTWANRYKARALKSDFEEQLGALIGQPVDIHMEGHIVYSTSDSGLMMGMLTLFAVSLIIMMGISLVPSLLFEEKQTKTMDALLVSPSSIGQVVVAKAVAGFFYVLVVAVVVFAFYWSGVVHWGMVFLFVVDIGLFSVAVGLVLGSFFERQQDITGWMTALLVVIVGSMFIDMVELHVPAFLRAILPWVPSVAMADVFRFAFSEHAPLAQVWMNLGSVLAISLLLFAGVAWKIRRFDR